MPLPLTAWGRRWPFDVGVAVSLVYEGLSTPDGVWMNVPKDKKSCQVKST